MRFFISRIRVHHNVDEETTAKIALLEEEIELLIERLALQRESIDSLTVSMSGMLDIIASLQTRISNLMDTVMDLMTYKPTPGAKAYNEGMEVA